LQHGWAEPIAVGREEEEEEEEADEGKAIEMAVSKLANVMMAINYFYGPEVDGHRKAPSKSKWITTSYIIIQLGENC